MIVADREGGHGVPLRALNDMTGLFDAPKVAETILGLMPETGVVVVDRDMRIALIEGPVFDGWGHDLTDVGDREVREIIPAAEWGNVRAWWEHALAGEPQTIEEASLGGHGLYWLHFAPLSTRQGVLVGAIMVAQDVTKGVRARQSLERRLSQQLAVSSLGDMALREVGLDPLFERAAEVLHSALGGDIAAVYERTPDGGGFVRARAGEPLTLPPAPVAKDPDDPLTVLRNSGRPMISVDIRREERFDSPVLAGQGMVSMVMAPIGVGPDAFGFLGACSREEDAFTEADLAFVQSVANVVSAATDAARNRALAQRREAQLNEAQRLAGMGSWETDLVSQRFSVSESLRAMLGLDDLCASFAEVFGRVHPDDRARVEAKFAGPALDTDVTEFRVVLPDDTERRLTSQAELVADEGRVVLIRGTVRDITESHRRDLALRRSEERFRQGFDNAPIAMALVDPATTRFVRVNDAICRFLGRSTEERTALTVPDVSHPDETTDREVLRGLASGELSAYTREKRYLRPDGTVVWGDLSVSTTFEADGAVDVLLAQIVDITERKEREDQVQVQLGEVSWLKEIREAFQEERFEVHAQPIIDLATGETVQHELLIRMRAQDGTLIPPGAFLPAAEKYGPIREIDRWMISRGSEIAARGIEIAINISGVSLGNRSLVAHIESELERTGADPSQIVFEITETALIEAGDTALHVATLLRELGCRFALDDFGTGYGGFHHLKTLPLDFLKIDQEFVHDATTNESDRHVIWAVVNLAQLFGLQTVAEGVENPETLTLLAGMGVDHAQGFHIGRPGPLDG